MNKLCCNDVERLTCPSSCCESRLEEEDSVDGEANLATPLPSPEKRRVAYLLGIFVIKRYANEIDRNSNCLKDGGKTSQDPL